MKCIHSTGAAIAIALLSTTYESSAHAASNASSTFDDGPDGWSLLGTSNPLEHSTSAGNPGGTVFSSFAGPGSAGFADIWYFVAPSKFLGDNSDAHYGTLTLDLRNPGAGSTGLDGHPEIVLVGSTGKTLLWDFGHPSQFFTSYIVPLDQTAVIQYGSEVTARWRIAGTSLQPTEADMREVLSSLASLRISGSYNLSGGVSYLDNVAIHATPAVPEPSTLALAMLGIGALAWTVRTRYR